VCPVCISTAATLVAGATCSGGVTALLVKKLLLAKSGSKAISLSTTKSQKEKP
jgi:hypothetical protein